MTDGNGRARGGVPKAAPKRSALYEVLEGIDFEQRQLVGKRESVGLLDLVGEGEGGRRCYACTLCERTCPVDCIQIEYLSEFPEQPFDIEAARAAALSTLPGGELRGGVGLRHGREACHFVPQLDMKLFDPVIAGIRSGSGLVEASHATQDAFGYLPRVALESIADEMHLPSRGSSGWPVSTANSDSARWASTSSTCAWAPPAMWPGRRSCWRRSVRKSTSPSGGRTPDGLFTLQRVNCVGACALAPVVRVGNDETFGRVGPREARRLVGKLRKREVAQ